MPLPGSVGTALSRDASSGPVWMVRTGREAAALALDHDGLLDSESVFLEDVHAPDADAFSKRAATFLRDHDHDALPRFFDAWTARDRTIHRFSPQSGWNGPIRHILTHRTAGVDGRKYLEQHRARGAGLPPAVALRIVERLADACRLAHAAGVGHGGILAPSVRVRPDGRPVLEFWGGGRSMVGNLGRDHEHLWAGVRDLLRAASPSSSPAGDVFALGSLLSLLVTGAPAHQLGASRQQYWSPSSRAEGFAWLDDVVGRACDPGRGFGMDAGALREALASLLDERRPSPGRVRADLQGGDLSTFAELVACADAPSAGPLAGEAGEAVARHVLGALARERPVPLFAELVLAVCPEARPLVRAFALDRSRSAWARDVALTLLALSDDAQALDVALTLDADIPGSLTRVGWSARPQLVTLGGAVCPHAWSSLRGEPTSDEHGALRRECPACGVVVTARSSLGMRWPWPPLFASTSDPEGPRLSVVSAHGVIESDLPPGVPHYIGSEPSCSLHVKPLAPLAPLDPADHAAFYAMDASRIAFTVGGRTPDGTELRGAVLDTRRADETLRIGPLLFVATAPGQVMVRADDGVQVTVRGA
ncbi:hypothetical protein [Chondromyces apiculatus]|uniref:Protein kinase domain-containing protein n=1 Tax=Chondromyces apiculatus DSM 436 TaxID=1192034 RepID=A0A017T7M8_9BACT|nr:hypothetical protein [Chondromyces apiculatus]EYF04561.1 Hypothetical protein CAP_4381 [Chondromyces apiculatus DSM 436]